MIGKKSDIVKRGFPWVVWPMMAFLVFGSGAAIHCKGLTSSEAAGWVQAAGSVGAIFAAIWILLRQDAAETMRQQESIHQLKLSIRDEISAIWTGFSERGGKSLVETAPGAFRYRLPLSENAFVIYTSSANRIAEIGDEQLRKQIIVTYGRGLSFIRSIQLNNRLVEQWMDADFQAAHMKSEVFTARAIAADEALKSYGPKLRLGYSELEADVKKLLSLMPQ